MADAGSMSSGVLDSIPNDIGNIGIIPQRVQIERKNDALQVDTRMLIGGYG